MGATLRPAVILVEGGPDEMACRWALEALGGDLVGEAFRSSVSEDEQKSLARRATNGPTHSRNCSRR
jgi:hypothetical protein